MSLSIDAKDLKGSQLYTALLPNQPANVDGFLSRSESNLIENGIDRNHNWLLLRTPNNFQILTSLTIQDKDETPISLLYQDDSKLKNKPERFVGQLPNFGYVVEKIPMESLYYMGVNFYFDDNKTQYDPVTYAEQIKSRPVVKVVGLNALNGEGQLFQQNHVGEGSGHISAAGYSSTIPTMGASMVSDSVGRSVN